MLFIVDNRIAERIKLVLTLSLEALSKTMENPEEFLTNGYWTIPVGHPIPEKAELYQFLLDSLTVEEEAFHIKWMKNWLNTYGWDFSDDLVKIIPFTPVNDTPATTGENQ